MKTIFALTLLFASAPLLAGTLFFVGDSTLDDHRQWCRTKAPFASWGRELESSLKPGWTIVDNAFCGQSVLGSLKDEQKFGGTLWDKTIKAVAKGDFVVIQFGHNDQKRQNPARYSPPDGFYREGLSRMVKEVREKGATPVLCSPIRRANFGKDGKLVDYRPKDGYSLGDYAAETVRLAKELRVDCVDMFALTCAHLEKLGKEESMKLYMVSTGKAFSMDGEPSHDTTHPIKAGADAFGALFRADAAARSLAVADIFASR